MATSGIKSFSFPVDTIIRQAMYKVGGEWTNAEEQEAARNSLNLLLLDLINKDAPLGSIKELSVSVGTSDGVFELENGTIGVLDMLVRTSNVVSVGTSSSEYGSGYTDINMARMSFIEFHSISDKNKSGRPSQFTTTVSAQQLKVQTWPINDTTPRRLVYYAIVQPDTVTRSYQDLDIMNRYLPAVVYGLAFELGQNRKGVSTEKLNMLHQIYEKKRQEAFDADRERTSFFARPVIR